MFLGAPLPQRQTSTTPQDAHPQALLGGCVCVWGGGGITTPEMRECLQVARVIDIVRQP